MKTYDDYKTEFKKLIESDDTECAHSSADELLVELCLDCAKSNISLRQANFLLNLYDKVNKWYA